ncbi:MAG: hypothetical protein J0H49_03420 [Acidobacteria bacterium]|nr:hypothetical protein [Acidobacteriota bacterium]
MQLGFEQVSARSDGIEGKSAAFVRYNGLCRDGSGRRQRYQCTGEEPSGFFDNLSRDANEASRATGDGVCAGGDRKEDEANRGDGAGPDHVRYDRTEIKPSTGIAVA